MKHGLRLTLAMLAIVLGVAGYWSKRPIERQAGVLVAADPDQTDATVAPFRFENSLITPRANYDITARVLSVERYRVDGGSWLAPIDFAVGWSKMSDSAVLKHFRVTQGARFFTIYPDNNAIELHEALHSASNMHLAPATSQVRDLLLRARVGNIAHLRGYLIDVNRDDGFSWHTSLTREDTGDGACELMWVEEVELR
jgi:hypothetical protein